MFCFAWRGNLGAVHALEVPFAFDNLDRNTELRRLLGGEQAPQSLSVSMHGAWVNFVKTGSPQHATLPDWPPYDPVRRATMHLDIASRIVDDPDSATRQLWTNTDY
jgi:para-nitrobenzyl esterase